VRRKERENGERKRMKRENKDWKKKRTRYRIGIKRDRKFDTQRDGDCAGKIMKVREMDTS
jgi:hypothetical protein